MSQEPTWNSLTPSSVNTQEIEKELELKRRQGFIKGAAILFASIIPLLSLFFTPPSFGNIILVPFLGGFFVVAIIGVVYLAFASQIQSYLYAIRILKRVNPNPVITEKYAVTKFADILIFVLKSTMLLYFVKLDTLNAVTSGKVKVPKVFWRWGKINLAGFKIHKRTGHFSVPTPDKQILSADCVLYALPILGEDYLWRVPDFSRENLFRLVAAISETEIHNNYGEKG